MVACAIISVNGGSILKNFLSNKKPIVWTISGSDSGGGAGIQADLLTFQDFAVHGCTVITALCAQNSFAVGYTIAAERKQVVAQINALDSDLPAKAIKLGMLLDVDTIETVAKYLQDYDGTVICDPMVYNAAGDRLIDEATESCLREKLLPLVDVLAVDVKQAARLTAVAIERPDDVTTAAEKLLALGVKTVIVGAALFAEEPESNFSYWLNDSACGWLVNEDIDTIHHEGSSCAFTSAIAAAIALDYSLEDALVIAHAYVIQGLRFAEQIGSGPGSVGHFGWPSSIDDLPEWFMAPLNLSVRESFPVCDMDWGVCPRVTSLEALQQVLVEGLHCVRIALPDEAGSQLHEAAALCEENNVQLIVEQHWSAAIASEAYGVHLSLAALERLSSSEIDTLLDSGLVLGVSVNNYCDIARAHGWQVSYVEVDHVLAEQGVALEQLEEWVNLLDEHYRVVAKGHINSDNIAEVMATGVDGVVMSSDELEDVTAGL